MNLLIKKYYLNCNLKVFFLFSKNLLFLFNSYNAYFFYLPSLFFVKNKLAYFFYFVNNFNFKSFLSHFVANYKKLCFFFFWRFKLRGLGYRVKGITKNIIRFFIGTTNFYYFYIPSFLFAKAKRRKLLLISIDKNLLSTVRLHIGFLKKIIPYKLRGLFFPRQIVLMKPGKKRF